jgi:DNA-binding GntR family transcriptional regulator
MSLVERAYREIKHRILHNQYGPGYQALEQEIADELGMSRTPVRESLIRLEKEGLVQCIPRRGMRVVPLSLDDLMEIYDVLTCLETMAAELLARKRPEAGELADLEQALAAMEAAMAADDLEAWAEGDDRFHRALLGLCGNRRLEEIAKTFRDQVYRARLATIRLRRNPEQSGLEHRAVLDAIMRGDWRRAREAHFRHRLRAKEFATEILSQHNTPEL